MKTNGEVWFVLAKLQVGGIEHNSLKLMSQCLQWGISVRLILLEGRGELMSSIPKDVHVTCLGWPFKAVFPLRLAKLVGERPPACVISAFDDLNLMVALARRLAGSFVPMLLSNHNTFSVAMASSSGLNKAKYHVLRVLLPWAFRQATCVLAVSRGVADDLSRTLSLPKESIHVVYNPIMDSKFLSRARQVEPFAINERTILFVGRLVRQKDVPNLLAACAILKGYRDIDVVVVGEGPERSRIEAEVDSLQLRGQVRLVGAVQNPLPLMAGSGVLVLPSRFEGLGNVLIEAMACGTQVVATDCPHGPAEVLEDGRFGQLVPVGDPQALAEAIERSLSRKFWIPPEDLNARAAEFSVEKATRRYLELAGYDVSTLPLGSLQASQIDPANG